MQAILDFKHRIRLTAFAKKLLQFPCMQPALNVGPANALQEYGQEWRQQYSFALLPEPDLLELANLQASRLEVNHDDAEIDISPEQDNDDGNGDATSFTAPECFANQSVYAKPRDYIKSLLLDLPKEKKLTRDQTLFMLRFAAACDEAWEDEKKPPIPLLLVTALIGQAEVPKPLHFPCIMAAEV